MPATDPRAADYVHPAVKAAAQAFRAMTPEDCDHPFASRADDYDDAEDDELDELTPAESATLAADLLDDAGKLLDLLIDELLPTLHRIAADDDREDIAEELRHVSHRGMEAWAAIAVCRRSAARVVRYVTTEYRP